MENNQNTNIPKPLSAENALDSQPAEVIEAVADKLLAEQTAASELQFGNESLNIKPALDATAEVMSEESRNSVFPNTQGVPEPLPQTFEAVPADPPESVLSEDIKSNYSDSSESEVAETPAVQPEVVTTVVSAGETLGAAALSESVVTEAPAEKPENVPEATEEIQPAEAESNETTPELVEDTAPVSVDAKVGEISEQRKTGVKARLAGLIFRHKN